MQDGGRWEANGRFSLLRGSGLKLWPLNNLYPRLWFSLLRGSGLKSKGLLWHRLESTVLPLTREWIEIARILPFPQQGSVLPLTREWIEISSQRCSNSRKSAFSLLRGSGLKSFVAANVPPIDKVLPLTREWIEISKNLIMWHLLVSSPSYEGVDWNDVLNNYLRYVIPFSLLRGSGLKSPLISNFFKYIKFSLLRGSGLK